MTLKRILRELDPNQKIKVGSKESSCFWYVGTADDMLKNLQVYNAYCDLHIDTMRSNAEGNLKRALAAFPSPADYARCELECKKPRLTAEGYMSALNVWFADIIRLNEKKEQKVRWDKEYQRIDDREVLESTMSDPTVENDVMRIIVHGHEHGKYWMFCEAPRLPSCAFAASFDNGDQDE